MDKIGERAVIQYFHKKGLTPNDIHNDMVATLGKDAPSYATVKRWVAEFKRGRQSLEDDPRPGRLVTATTPEMVNKVHDIVMTESSLKVCCSIRTMLLFTSLSLPWLPFTIVALN